MRVWCGISLSTEIIPEPDILNYFSIIGYHLSSKSY